MIRGLRAAALALAIPVLLSGCILDLERREGVELVDEYTDATFYDLPADLAAGKPGDIIRYVPMLDAPAGSLAWRVIYHSTDMAGADAPVAGIVVVPALPAPEGGRPVVSWAHPTTGAAQKCGPSLDKNPFSLMAGLEEFLAEGFAYVATDYQGMTVAGASSYLLGVTEGNNVLDMVRAARTIPLSGVGTDVLLWGHSQGGQAALFAAQQAQSYAPELDVRAVATAAPAADLNALMTDDIIDLSGVTIASLAIPAMTAAYSERYSVDELQAILTPAGAEATPKMAELCLLSQTKDLHAIADPLVGNYVTGDPATTEPWATILRENSAGGSPIGVPVFVGQGLADQLVIPTATEGFVSRLCAAGEQVQFDRYNDITHALAGLTSVPYVMDFFAKALAGHAPSNCP